MLGIYEILNSGLFLSFSLKNTEFLDWSLLYKIWQCLSWRGLEKGKTSNNQAGISTLHLGINKKGMGICVLYRIYSFIAAYLRDQNFRLLVLVLVIVAFVLSKLKLYWKFRNCHDTTYGNLDSFYVWSDD